MQILQEFFKKARIMYVSRQDILQNILHGLHSDKTYIARSLQLNHCSEKQKKKRSIIPLCSNDD